MITFFPPPVTVEVEPRRSLNFARWEIPPRQDMLQINSPLEAEEPRRNYFFFFLLLPEKCNYTNFMKRVRRLNFFTNGNFFTEFLTSRRDFNAVRIRSILRENPGDVIDNYSIYSWYLDNGLTQRIVWASVSRPFRMRFPSANTTHPLHAFWQWRQAW